MNIAVLDLETDPFEYGVSVKPFLSGFYDGERTISHWGNDCIERLVKSLESEERQWTIYAHNGGRFDFFFFLNHLSRGDMRIINGRIVEARMGNHIVRDSFAIMPFPLADYAKDTIDYNLMRAENRTAAKGEILRYFQKDLTSLYELVVAFHKEFGDKLTIGSASMKELRKRSAFKCGTGEYDAKFRKDFYFGGRNQVFKGGIHHGDIRVYDVNSMYPFVMLSSMHPIGTANNVSKWVEKNSVFVVAEGHNFGAFPQRQPDNSLDFSIPYGRFCCTIHEWNVALDTGTFKPTKIIKSYTWDEQATFEEFVSHFYDARRHAKETGDKIKTIFYKFVLNSAYGKFAQDPDNYFDWFITPYGEQPNEWHECGASCVEPCSKVWHPAYVFELSYIIWKRPITMKMWYNIATGASITGAARAVLLKGICDTREPLYCDTDSIICRDDSRVAVHASRLGAWDLEASGSMVAIAGKKLYTVLDPAGQCIKKAHKGVRLTSDEIVKIATGETVIAENPVPHFAWDGKTTFTRRTIKRTARQ